MKEKEEKVLKKHFQVSAVDPRLQSPYMRVIILLIIIG